MGQSLEHIKNIVSAQQSFAKGGLAKQKFEMKDVIEDALRINSMALDRHKVRVERKYGPVPTLEADKHLVMQILVNLINNAKKAVRDSGRTDRLITLTSATAEHDGRRWVVMSVADNGVGIPPENLTRVFTHGFTTRPDGHGFGLHAAANSARQMDGSLIAASDGPGRGAVFTLELPI
jgi:C4-dicarboxylate-specific signal transduction histidine kinase